MSVSLEKNKTLARQQKNSVKKVQILGFGFAFPLTYHSVHNKLNHTCHIKIIMLVKYIYSTI